VGSYEELPPRADSMVESLRAMGYDLSMAIADLIDNSIFANATNVWISYKWKGTESWICILDDGLGMTELQLKDAMRLGNKNPTEIRAPEDLGRFGLGLKTASFSQCKLITVRTKTDDGKTSERCWDLDHVNKSKKWEIATFAPEDTDEILAPLKDLSHGTIVLWQNLDRIIDKNAKVKDEEAKSIFYNKFTSVRQYLEMVFHQYLTPPLNLHIKVGRDVLKPWDPYMKSNQFTQLLSKEKYEDSSVVITPWVLPHVANRSNEETNIGAGPKGWNAQQGFYVYRNKRMIVSGGYLDLELKPEEHYKLARIMVEIPNNMDQDWCIDVRKATAKPPDRLKAEILRIAKATREQAVKVYRARLRTTSIGGRAPSTHDVWIRKKRGDKIIYEINKNHEVIKKLLEDADVKDTWVKRLFQVIESTIPHRTIIIDNSENEDCHVALPSDIQIPEKGLIELAIQFYREYRNIGKSHLESVEHVLTIEPFNTHPVYAAALDKIYEEEEKDG